MQPGAAWCSNDQASRIFSKGAYQWPFDLWSGRTVGSTKHRRHWHHFDPAEKNSLRGLSSKLASGRFLLKVSYPKKSMVLPSRSARRFLQRLDLRKRRCVQVHRFRSPNSGPAGPRCRMFRKPWSCTHHMIHMRHGETKTQYVQGNLCRWAVLPFEHVFEEQLVGFSVKRHPRKNQKVWWAYIGVCKPFCPKWWCCDRTINL